IDSAIEKASMTPARVEPCLPSLRNTSPRLPSSYIPAVMYLSAPATLKEVVTLVRFLGSRLRTGCDKVVGADSPALAPFSTVAFLALASDSGWPTLQLSR